MAMKNQDIIDLMGRFDASGIARLRLTIGDTTLELEKPGAAPALKIVPFPVYRSTVSRSSVAPLSSSLSK